MNLNNLQDLKQEMKRLGFSEQLTQQMQQQMKAGVKEFNLRESIPGDTGKIDFKLYFKQSNKSEYYYFNKYEVAHQKGKVLKEGEKYLVTSTALENGKKDVFQLIDQTIDAIAFFRKQEGDSQLLVVTGQDPKQQLASGVKLAIMEDGRVIITDESFKKTFYTPVPVQTFYVEQGRGYTANQAGNLVQGRAVYRDDMLSMQGVAFKAWMELNPDKELERNGNLSFNQYHDPAYGFDLKSELEKYNIKELSDPIAYDQIESALKSGNRTLVTVDKDGEQVKLKVEPSIRYLKLNFFDLKGKLEKREQFLKQPTLAQSTQQKKSAENTMEKSQGVSL